jgi:hypothetical protein
MRKYGKAKNFKTSITHYSQKKVKLVKVYTKALSESDHWLQKVKGNKIPS